MTRALVSCVVSFGLVICSWSTRAESPPLRWDQTDSSVALVRGGEVLWKFHYGPGQDAPYFHPVSTVDGHVLTWNSPSDHAWHHGLWFCWKYINGVNYWEHDRQTGKPAGRTQVAAADVEFREDHSASIGLKLDYHPAGEEPVVLSERRRIEITAPNADGEYQFDWTCDFTVGPGEVVLDRTPPKEQSWGGYAGLSVRFAKDILDRQAIADSGPVEFGPGNRHRSHSTAMEYCGTVQGDPVGLAFLDHPNNPRHPTPWYVIRSPVMSYMNAALLNDEPMTLQPGEQMTLRYRLIVHAGRWDADRLRKAHSDFVQSVPSK